MISSSTLICVSLQVTLLWSVRISCSNRLRIIRLNQFKDIEEFYRDVRRVNRKSYDEPGPSTAVRSKRQICSSIFDSTFFYSIGVTAVDVDKKRVYMELKFRYPRIRKEIFEKSPSHLRALLGRRYRYVNPTTPIRVHLAGRDVPEFAFLCLGRCELTKKIRKIYVSEEYNLNITQSDQSQQSHVPGRFLFVVESDLFKFVVMSVVEESAETVAIHGNDLKQIYLEARRGKTPAIRAKDDPLCGLDVNKRVEICTSVFGSAHFLGRVNFALSPGNVSEECRKYRVAVESDDAAVFEEWMMYCVVDTTEKASPRLAHRIHKFKRIIYYLSRAYSSGHVFVYTFLEGMLQVENLSKNVIHVQDSQNTRISPHVS